MADGHHHTKVMQSIAPSKYPDEKKYRAVCDCGWIGQLMDRKADAEEDANEHVRMT